MLRGNAILHIIAEKLSVEAGTGAFDVYHRAPFLITFRGGKWKPWWEDDIQLLAALVVTYSDISTEGTLVIHELDGDVTLRYIPLPPNVEALVNRATTDWNPDTTRSRISKKSGRAAVLCKYCPIRSECARLDLEYGMTEDWT